MRAGMRACVSACVCSRACLVAALSDGYTLRNKSTAQGKAALATHVQCDPQTGQGRMKLDPANKCNRHPRRPTCRMCGKVDFEMAAAPAGALESLAFAAGLRAAEGISTSVILPFERKLCPDVPFMPRSLAALQPSPSPLGYNCATKRQHRNFNRPNRQKVAFHCGSAAASADPQGA